MLVDRYAPRNLFTLIPELEREFDPQLRALDRLLGRLLRRTKAALGETAGLGKEAFRSHVRTVRRLTQELHRVARRKGEEAAEALTDQPPAPSLRAAPLSRPRPRRPAPLRRLGDPRPGYPPGAAPDCHGPGRSPRLPRRLTCPRPHEPHDGARPEPRKTGAEYTRSRSQPHFRRYFAPGTSTNKGRIPDTTGSSSGKSRGAQI
jgi:hypothetical protein